MMAGICRIGNFGGVEGNGCSVEVAGAVSQ
jgi:hypothetical protein